MAGAATTDLRSHADKLIEKIKVAPAGLGYTVGATYSVPMAGLGVPVLGASETPLQQLKCTLTLKPLQHQDTTPRGKKKGTKRKAASQDPQDEAETPSFEVFHEDPETGRLHLPRYFGLSLFGVPQGDADTRTLGAPLGPAVRFTAILRQDPPQLDIVEAADRVLRSPLGGAMIKVGCGKGKTVCALAEVMSLGRRAAVLINNGKTLQPQWMERIQQFMPGARVGVLRQKKAQIEGYDIILCSIQSLMQRDYDQALMDTIGTVIVDEAHHIGARVFSRCMRQFRARYTIGLSATPKRKDGLGRFVTWMLGPIVVELPTTFHHVTVIQYTWKDTKVKTASHMSGDRERVQMVTNAIEDYPRAVVMLRLIQNCLAHAPGRTVLVLTERVKQVEYFADWWQQQSVASVAAGGREYIVARIHGTVSKEELQCATERAHIIVATYNMANEALDIARIDTLAFLTPPVGFIEQIVGRIIRIHNTKLCPLVLDLKDPVGLFAGMANKRKAWYAIEHFLAVHCVELTTAIMDTLELFRTVVPSTIFTRLNVLDCQNRVPTICVPAGAPIAVTGRQ